MDCPQHENGAGGEDEECCGSGSGCGSGDGETTTTITTKITSTTTEQYTCQDGSMISITKVCNLNRPIHSSHFQLAFWISLSCRIETTSITQQLRVEIIITDHGKCFSRFVTVSWTVLYMKAGLEGRTRRIAMVSTFKIR